MPQKKESKYYVISALLIITFFFVWGILTIHKQIFPFSILLQVYRIIVPRPVSTSDLSTIKIDLDSIRSSFGNSKSKLNYLRKAVIVPKDIVFVNRYKYKDTESIITTIYGLSTISQLTKTTVQKNKCILIYVQGHDGGPFDFSYHNYILEKVTAGGCDVFSMSMIGHGSNQNKSSFPTHFGSLLLDKKQSAHHGNYSFFYDSDNIQLDPLALFISPHYYTIKEIIDEYQESALIGISGGGWYVSFLSALIPEINVSLSSKTKCNTNLEVLCCDEN